MTMNYMWRHSITFFSVVYLTLALCACSGDTPWRYNPGAPDTPAGLVATAENGQISLSWPAADNASAYSIYYATSPGVSRATGNKIATVVSTSYIQSGLTNNTTYYYVITSVNSSGESAESNQVSASPTLSGAFVQKELEGSWNFNILVSGVGSGWMRGTCVVDNRGSVTFGSFLSSAGETVPPADLFRSLVLTAAGEIYDTHSGLQGVMAVNRKIIVGTASSGGTSHQLVIFQKQVPGVTFSNAGDIQGFGSSGGGGRRFVYNQISSGSSQEWEFAAGQTGRDQKVQYSAFIAPSNPVKPADKASILNISADGIVTESLAGASPQPAVVIDRGIMSADKSMIIGTATDTSGASPRYVLRIYQLVNIIASDPNSFIQADLGGTYDFHLLSSSSAAMTASGAISITASGTAAYSSYTDSNGNVSLPAGFSLAVNTDGTLSNAAEPTLLGKYSYFKNMIVMTNTDVSGICSLTIALKR